MDENTLRLYAIKTSIKIIKNGRLLDVMTSFLGYEIAHSSTEALKKYINNDTNMHWAEEVNIPLGFRIVRDKLEQKVSSE